MIPLWQREQQFDLFECRPLATWTFIVSKKGPPKRLAKERVNICELLGWATCEAWGVRNWAEPAQMFAPHLRGFAPPVATGILSTRHVDYNVLKFPCICLKFLYGNFCHKTNAVKKRHPPGPPGNNPTTFNRGNPWLLFVVVHCFAHQTRLSDNATEFQANPFALLGCWQSPVNSREQTHWFQRMCINASNDVNIQHVSNKKR